MTGFLEKGAKLLFSDGIHEGGLMWLKSVLGCFPHGRVKPGRGAVLRGHRGHGVGTSSSSRFAPRFVDGLAGEKFGVVIWIAHDCRQRNLGVFVRKVILAACLGVDRVIVGFVLSLLQLLVFGGIKVFI